ncbi:hypothetical protein V6N12_018315 [Hibiscus sabdariffa]|uniref:Uncharacterized protein n=1 Tax=Hibiscus sabdariffa TaxID=183260 RepID=A0ABR2BQP5_9ROSI
MLSSPLKICIICRPKENERVRVEPTKSCAYHMELQAAFTESMITIPLFLMRLHFFQSLVLICLSSYQCVAVDAVVEDDLVSALNMSVQPFELQMSCRK